MIFKNKKVHVQDSNICDLSSAFVLKQLPRYSKQKKQWFATCKLSQAGFPRLWFSMIDLTSDERETEFQSKPKRNEVPTLQIKSEASLSPDQKAVFRAVLAGKNIFFTGSAGWLISLVFFCVYFPAICFFLFFFSLLSFFPFSFFFFSVTFSFFLLLRILFYFFVFSSFL